MCTIELKITCEQAKPNKQKFIDTDSSMVNTGGKWHEGLVKGREG